MTDYGVVPTGFVRKPLATVLAEIETAMITQFGPGFVQTSQSPAGQLNGVMADFIAQLWEFAEDIYQSYDPDQAEGTRLNTLAKMRLLFPQSGESEASFRQAITNAHRARVDVQDLARGISGLAGVTYSQVFVNETDQTDDAFDLSPNTIAVAVIGGDEDEIGATMRTFIVPGISTYGNTYISTNIDGFCRSMAIIRPILVPVTLAITVNAVLDKTGCAPPSTTAIRAALVDNISLINGEDITWFKIRSVIESIFPNVEVVSFVGTRDGITGEMNEPVEINFLELATLTLETVTVTFAA